VAHAAKDFYTKYPNDPRAGSARKLEAISALHATDSSDLAQLQAARTIAQAYRTDPANAVTDRFEVARAMDRQELSAKLTQRRIANHGPEEKGLVDSWRVEFGDLPELDVEAAGVARRSDPATANALAAGIIHSKAAPAAAKAEAQAIAGRVLLLGSLVQLKLKSLDHSELDLAAQQNKTTLVVVWSASAPASLEAFTPLTGAFRSNTQLIYLALGDTKGAVESTRHKLDLPTGPLWPCGARGGNLRRSRTLPKAAFIAPQAGASWA